MADRRLLWFSTLLAALLLTPLVSQSRLGELREAVPKGRSHPFLHFEQADLEAMRERTRSDPRARPAFQQLLAEGSRLLDLPISHEVPPRFRGINPYFDGQDAFGLYRGELSSAAYQLAFLYQLTGEAKYARKSYEFAAALSELDSWVDTWDKFSWLYWMGKPYGSKYNEEEDNEIVYSFELGAAGTARQMAAVYDWLYPALDRFQRKRLANALLENAILRVRGNYDYHWWAHSWRCNWLPVCFAGVGLAALALAPEDPQVLDVVEESRARITRYIEESTGGGGGYQEGLGYWHYGFENAVLFADSLKRATGGRVNMFEHPDLRRTAQFPLYLFTPPRGGVAFGDGREHLAGSWELYNKLALETGDAGAKWLAGFFDPLRHSVPHQGELELFSIIWPEAPVEAALPSPPQPQSMHFTNIDWLILRASWLDPEIPLVAAKGGIHDDPHHGHLDSGQFALKYLGKWFIRELGYMSPYGYGYWDYRRRWDYVHANSEGHNVIFVDGERQQYGPEFSSKVTDFRTSQEQDYALIDATGAYPGKQLKAWRRHIVFQKPSWILLMDEVESEAGAEVAARFHPGVSYQLRDRHVLLQAEEGSMAALSLAPAAFSYREDRHAFLGEQRKAALSWIPFYEQVTRAAGPRTFLFNLFVPVKEAAEAEQILRSASVRQEGGRLLCRVGYRGHSYSAAFDVSGAARLLSAGKESGR